MVPVLARWARDGAIEVRSFEPLAVPPAGAVDPRHTSPIQITDDGASIWVANPDSDSVARIATATNTLAGEFPVGDNPRKRHHVRFWRSAELDAEGRPLWVGSVTFDERVGLSDTTGQVTHHIAPDVDAERDGLFADLEKAGAVTDVERVPGFHKIRSGKNGGGDPWRTDGALLVGTVVPK